ncbi:MAG: glycosyltransferase family 4 protein [Candidatus Omnitrophica bacterium]|nr:glycosyltransferase family 4 protein [Candidatus Omnitrophota bacterium]
MRILQVIPGTANFYCGSCIRDSALVRAFRQSGHDVTVAPLYLPLYSDEPEVDSHCPVFFGGVNVYLQQKTDWFQKTPRWLDRLLDSRWLLNLSAKNAGMTGGAELGEMTVSMLRGSHGRQTKELIRLLEWLKTQGKFDAALFSNGMLLGLAVEIKKALGVPVACSFQGEDGFLDALHDSHRSQAWDLFSSHARQIDARIPVSFYYAEVLHKKLGIPLEDFSVIQNGITLDGFGEMNDAPPRPVLGYLARMCKDKGLDALVEAFIQLKQNPAHRTLKLKIAGVMTKSDQPFVSGLQQRLERHSLLRDVEFLPNITREEKIAFLKSLSVLSVPAAYSESFGLYVVEAMAAGVPVVQPDHAGFREIIHQTGGGVLYHPGDFNAYIAALSGMLSNAQEARRLGQQGRSSVFQHFSLDRMTRDVIRVLERISSRNVS